MWIKRGFFVFITKLKAWHNGLQFLWESAKPQCRWNSRINCLICGFPFFFFFLKCYRSAIGTLGTPPPCLMTFVFFYCCNTIIWACMMHYKFGILGTDTGGNELRILVCRTITTVLVKALKRTAKAVEINCSLLKKIRKKDKGSYPFRGAGQLGGCGVEA